MIDYFRAYQRIPKSLPEKYKLCDGVLSGYHEPMCAFQQDITLTR